MKFLYVITSICFLSSFAFAQSINPFIPGTVEINLMMNAGSQNSHSESSYLNY